MSNRELLRAFYQALNSTERIPLGPPAKRWTLWMMRRLNEAAGSLKCYTICRDKHRPENGEYLNIDVTLFENCTWESWRRQGFVLKGYDPFVLPVGIVEHDNNYDPAYLAYCLWKLLCHRCPVRALICYQPIARVHGLIARLESTVRRGRLLGANSGGLSVVVGREGVADDAPWEDYFWSYQWTSQGFQRLGSMRR